MKQLFRIALVVSGMSLLSNSDIFACHCLFSETEIDSAAVKPYVFIALVTIIDAQDDKEPLLEKDGTVYAGVLHIRIRELFKGHPIDRLIEHDKNSSCDLGISTGEEWVLFGRLVDEKIVVTACDRNVRYKRADGFRDWQHQRGIRELRQLQNLYGHLQPAFSTETRKEFYPEGRLELEEVYLNGKLDGERKVWYPNGQLYGLQKYSDGIATGKEVWFYPSGQVLREQYYAEGKPSNVTRTYYDSTIDLRYKEFLIREFYKTEDSLNFVYKRVQLMYEIVYDSSGNPVIDREYSRLGMIKSERLMDPVRGFTTSLYYHENGVLRSIGHRSNQIDFGHYQEYDSDGQPTKSWDYDEKGRRINMKIR